MIIFSIFIIHLSLNYTEDEKEGTSLETLNDKYKLVSDKVVSYIVNANVKIDGKIVKGQVLEDSGNGTMYCIKVGNEIYWVSCYDVEILKPNEVELPDLTASEIAFYINYNNFTSDTDYLIWVDIYRNQLYLLKKENGYFYFLERFMCSTGANITPTKKGLYKLERKGESFLSRDKSYRCYYFMQYSNSYLIHSFPYDLNDNVIDDRLNERVSNGCVRLKRHDCKYIYDLITINTTIYLN